MTKQVKKAKDAPPYDPEAVCEKCGSTDVFTSLCDNSNAANSCNRFLDTMPWDREVEHMDRTCRRCGYDWWEAPISPKTGKPN